MSNIVVFDSGLVLLFGTLVFEVNSALLLALLATAVFYDLRKHRIPNGLVLSGLLLALAFHTFLPYGWGIGYALKGAAVGLGVFLPLYLLRGMGAGDVKLMAMVGAFLGPASAFAAVLLTLMCGGVLAIGAARARGVLPAMIASVRFMVAQTALKVASGGQTPIGTLPASAGKLPYAIAIASGTVVQLVLVRSGNAFLG